jgi:transposase InsO family protein
MMSVLAAPTRPDALQVLGVTLEPAAIIAGRHARGPNRLWIVDLSQVWGGTTWLYFAYVLDRDTGRCLSFSPHRVPHAELVSDALREAVAGVDAELELPVPIVLGRGCRTAELEIPNWALPSAWHAARAEAFVRALRQAAADNQGECRWASFAEARGAARAWIDQNYNSAHAVRRLPALA